ncbi:MAG: hypothetical protein H8D42_04720 [Candidatus Marinimicrobia bacterium]|nr:hypothetical protein [Candidatus Neomarinimicrobiota bacterium]
MTTEDIKKEMIRQGTKRFAAKLIIDELTLYAGIADIAIVDMNSLLKEIEIKTDAYDLTKQELKKEKWFGVKSGYIPYLLENIQKKEAVPAYFYFCVTPELRHIAINLVEDDLPFAGIYIAEQDLGVITFKSIRRAKKLHNNPISQKLLMSITQAYYYRWINLRIR